MTINRYHKGQKIRLTGTFTLAGVDMDPTAVTLKVKDPAGTTSTYTYALAQVAKSATGIYYKDISIDASGSWHYSWIGTGSVEAVDETFLLCEPSEF